MCRGEAGKVGICECFDGYVDNNKLGCVAASSPSIGIIIGAVIGSVLLIGIVVLVVCIVRRKNINSGQSSNTTSTSITTMPSSQYGPVPPVTTPVYNSPPYASVGAVVNSGSHYADMEMKKESNYIELQKTSNYAIINTSSSSSNPDYHTSFPDAN